MAALIYWKEASSYDISFLKIVFWQLIVWLPWSIMTPIFIKKISKEREQSNFQKYSFLTFSILIPILIHWCWFALYSSYFSPFLGTEGCRYGVFRYFFIFWSLIDFAFLITLTAYYTGSGRNSDTITTNVSSTVQVKRGNKKVFLKSESIYWVSAEGYYINIHSDQGSFLLRRSLKDILNSLSESSFIQIHRSAIINTNHLSELKQSSNQKIIAVMKDGKSHPVSRTYVKSLKEFLKTNSI